MYPKGKKQQVEFWLGQVGYARARMKPLFDASEVLANQYYNDAAGAREAELESGGAGADLHARRVKSGIVFGWIDQSIANMIDRSPIFKVFPETRDAAQKIDPQDSSSLTRADAVSKIVNYRYRETNQLRVDERVATDAFLFPYGVAKIGYTVDFEKRRQEFLLSGEPGDFTLEDPEDENLFLGVGTQMMVLAENDHVFHIQSHEAFRRLGALDGRVSGPGQAAVEEHLSRHKAMVERKGPDANQNVRFEAPFAVRWMPDMFLTDTLSMEGPQDARWIAFGWELPLEEVQADPSYENTKKLKTHRALESPDRSESFRSDDTDGFDLVYGWEIWAKNWPVGGGKFRDILLTVAEGCEDFLRYEEEWPYTNLDDYPVETLVFQPGLKSWFRKSPLLMGGADTTQALVNEILDSFLNIIRKTKNVWLVDPSSGLTETVLQDVLDAPDGSIVEVPGLAEAGGKSVVPLPFHAIPPEKGELLSLIQNLFDRGMGTPQPMALAPSSTATSASISERRNSSRENRRSALVSEYQIRKAKKMWQLDTQYQPDRLFLLDKANLVFSGITPDIARGEYLFTMDITSHADALAVERSQWMDLLNLFAGLTPVLTQAGGSPPNLEELARRLLVRGFEERMVEEIFPKKEEAPPPAAPPVEGAPPPEGAQPPPEGDMATLMAQMGMAAPAAPVEGNREGTDFPNPMAQALQEGVENGRAANAGIGPLIPEQFNRGVPAAGQLQGAQSRV